ncbi:unnamed protein product [Cylicocyclus nassatus]|uniref:Calponin-homology (CH) domain-containing protein n=1 Tax=Cylicocyclus nassatus TaxID=53992 RepID=A0AA36GWS0_CYLNA|nr:unnamed protein product [Cylicocyclus nassatus]
MEGSTKLDSSRLSSAQKVKHRPKLPYNVPEPRFSDISSIRPSDATFSVDQGGAGNIVENSHSHFLLHTCLFCYFVETAKANSIINHNPSMFTKSSSFKCMDDVFAELSREVLSGSGTPLNKAFAKMGFRPTYKQGFADDYNYTVKDFSDLTDGVILAVPRGDRLRKIGNVKVCLQTACDRGVDLGAVKAEAITGANKEAILKVLWRLVGVYVGADEERDLRRASLALAHQNNKFNLGADPDDISGEQFVLHICKQIDNMGQLRLQFKLFHKPLFGWKGSFFYISGCKMIYDIR